MLVVDSIPVETAFKMIEFLETCFGFSVILGHFEACFFFFEKTPGEWKKHPESWLRGGGAWRGEIVSANGFHSLPER